MRDPSVALRDMRGVSQLRIKVLAGPFASVA
jgi:hypothetical protein